MMEDKLPDDLPEHPNICEYCRFFDTYNNAKGLCRRYPPSVVSSEYSVSELTVYPEVTTDDWCGEFKE